MLRTDFTSQEYLRDPAAAIEKLRSSGPVVRMRFPIIGKVWITTTQELAARVLKDSDRFTLRRESGAIAGLRWWMPGIVRAVAENMLTMDEPDHTRLRGIVDEAFRRRAILDMEPRILAIADELAGALFAEGSPADLVERYARKLPLSVICELLGLPPADRPRFIAWMDSFTRLTGAIGFLGLIPAMAAMKRYLERRLDSARVEGGEGLIAELVRVEKEGGRISPREMVAMVFLLLGAGTETTTHLISGSVYELVERSEPPRLAGSGLEPRHSGGRRVPPVRLAGAVLEAALCAARPGSRRRPRAEGREDHGHAGGGQHGPESERAPRPARSQEATQSASRLRHGHPPLPRPPTRAHRRQVRAASLVHALAGPRDGRSRLANPVARAAGAPGARGPARDATAIVPARLRPAREVAAQGRAAGDGGRVTAAAQSRRGTPRGAALGAPSSAGPRSGDGGERLHQLRGPRHDEEVAGLDRRLRPPRHEVVLRPLHPDHGDAVLAAQRALGERRPSASRGARVLTIAKPSSNSMKSIILPVTRCATRPPIAVSG